MHWDVAAWGWLIGVGGGILLLGLAIAYGSGMWRRARQTGVPDAGREAATREVYRQEQRRNRSG